MVNISGRLRILCLAFFYQVRIVEKVEDPCGMPVCIGVDGAVNSSSLRVEVRSQRKDISLAMIL